MGVLQSELLRTIGDYDTRISYSPPCPFDILLEDFIRDVPELSVLVVPAVVSEGTAMGLVQVLLAR
jgi:hypothetical protein